MNDITLIEAILLVAGPLFLALVVAVWLETRAAGLADDPDAPAQTPTPTPDPEDRP